MKFSVALALSSAITATVSAECPIPTFGADSLQYRDQQMTGYDGQKMYLGFKNEYAAECESCSTSGSEDTNGNWVSTFGYNFAWNAEVGTREFWEQSAQGHKKKAGWFGSCPFDYESDSWWGGKCVIPDDKKFLGETCSDKDQCSNGFTGGYVDTTCAPTNNDQNDPQYKCVLDEMSNAVSAYADTCSCFGFLFCESSDCAGNQCVLSTMDMKKHCKWEDEAMFFNGGACSNCRSSSSTCATFDGTDKFSKDSSRTAAVLAGTGMGAAAVVGVGVGMKKRKAGMKGKQEKHVELPDTV